MKVLGIVAKWVFILCLPVLLLTASIGWMANSLWFYQSGFSRYDARQTTGLAEVELEKVARGLIRYFNSDEEYISLIVMKDSRPFEIFNQREIIHLRDVKGLIRLDYWVLLGTFVCVLGYAGVSLFWWRRRYWRRLAWGMVAGGSITLALMFALGLGTLLGFDQLFLQLHLISFRNPFWQLDPATDYLIMLVPRGFWYDATLFCALATVTGALIFSGVGGVYLKRTRESAP